MKGYIRNILNASAVDGPGNRMVIFFQGCNLNCTYCHNPETIELYHRGLHEDVREMTIEDILNEIKQVLPFISGVTVSGGECSIQFPFLLALAKALKNQNISLYVDTNGTLPIEQMKDLCQYVAGFMLDVKALNPSIHMKIIGSSNANVLKNLEFLAKNHKLYEVRTVVIPKVIDNEAVIDYVSSVLADYDPEVRYKLIRYRGHGVRSPYIDTYESPSEKEMQNLEAIALGKGLKKVILV